MGLFSSLLGGKKSSEEQQKKDERRKFDVLKYDGVRARSMGQLPYAIKCFEEALALQADGETMSFLAGAYLQANRMDDARSVLERWVAADAGNVSGWLSLSQVCFLQEDYERMAAAAAQAIQIGRASCRERV